MPPKASAVRLAGSGTVSNDDKNVVWLFPSDAPGPFEVRLDVRRPDPRRPEPLRAKDAVEIETRSREIPDGRDAEPVKLKVKDLSAPVEGCRVRTPVPPTAPTKLAPTKLALKSYLREANE